MLAFLPDQAMLPTIALWAAGGGLVGLALTAANWVLKPGVFGEIVREEPLHIPGAPRPEHPAPPPWSAAGLHSAIFCAVMGGLFAWGWYGPEETRSRIGIAVAVLGLAQSAWLLLHTMGDIPVVGEPPPADPDETAARRLPGALGGLAMAAAGVAMAWFD